MQKHSRKNITTGMMVAAISERQKFNKINKKGLDNKLYECYNKCIKKRKEVNKNVLNKIK